MKRILVLALVASMTACNGSGSDADKCTFIPAKEVITVTGSIYGGSSGNAVVGVITNDKQEITEVAIRYIDILKDGKVTRIVENISREKRPELSPVIDAIEKGTLSGKIKCSGNQPLHLQYLTKLSFQ